MKINVTPVKVKLDLTNSADKVTDTVVSPIQGLCKGAAKMFNALVGPFVARWEGKQKLIEAQYEKFSQDILAGKLQLKSEKPDLIPIQDISSFDELCDHIVQIEPASKAKRLQSTLGDGIQEIQEIPDDEVSDEPIDQTFFNRWQQQAELIEDEEVRKWWAHLLVEETKKPKSISPRTLDVAKNLSKDEANLFVKVSKGIVNTALAVDSKGHPACGVYSEILTLQDAGLVCSQTSNQTMQANAHNQQNQKIVALLYPESKVAIIFEKEKVSFQCNFLTVAGCEILNISHINRTLDDFMKIAEVISKQNNNVVASIIPIKAIGGDVNGSTSFQLIWLPLWTNHPET